MNQKPNFVIIISCILVYSLFLSGCDGDESLVFSPVPSFPQTPSQIKTSVTSATVAITVTPTLNNQSFIITPDDLFSFPKLKVLSTPNSAGFCEYIPPPQIVANADELSLLSGKFLLCPSISWLLVNTAMDLDIGSLVSVDNKSADIVLEYAHVPIDGTISYFVMGLNNAYIDERATDVLNYKYCKNVLLSLDEDDPGVLNVHEGAIACIMTTENQIALIRVENIYPLDTQSVEFSFAILKNE